MRKVTILIGAMAFALVAQTEAATTKVTFGLTAYSQGADTTLTSKTVSAGVIETGGNPVSSLKITEKDILAWCNVTNAAAYLMLANFDINGNSSEIDLVDGITNHAPFKVFDVTRHSATKSTGKSFVYNNVTSGVKMGDSWVDTTYAVDDISLNVLHKEYTTVQLNNTNGTLVPLANIIAGSNYVFAITNNPYIAVKNVSVVNKPIVYLWCQSGTNPPVRALNYNLQDGYLFNAQLGFSNYYFTVSYDKAVANSATNPIPTLKVQAAGIWTETGVNWYSDMGTTLITAKSSDRVSATLNNASGTYSYMLGTNLVNAVILAGPGIKYTGK